MLLAYGPLKQFKLDRSISNGYILVGMAFGSTLQRLFALARVALASILLVGVPIADAAACAGEEITGSVEASLAADDLVEAGDDGGSGSGDHDRRPGDDQHCVHGHCHHVAAFRNSDTSAPALTMDATAFPRAGLDTVLTWTSAGPERPPRG